MEVSYTLTEDDYRAYVEWMAGQPPTAQALQRWRMTWAIVFVLFAALFAVAGEAGESPVLLILAGVLLVAAAATYLTFGARLRTSHATRSLALLASGKTAYLLGPRTARISAEGFALSGPGLSASYSWAIVDHVDWSPTAVYIFMGGAQAHVVPRSAFGSDEELQAFAQAAQGYLAAQPAA